MGIPSIRSINFREISGSHLLTTSPGTRVDGVPAASRPNDLNPMTCGARNVGGDTEKYHELPFSDPFLRHKPTNSSCKAWRLNMLWNYLNPWLVVTHFKKATEMLCRQNILWVSTSSKASCALMSNLPQPGTCLSDLVNSHCMTVGLMTCYEQLSLAYLSITFVIVVGCLQHFQHCGVMWKDPKHIKTPSRQGTVMYQQRLFNVFLHCPCSLFGINSGSNLEVLEASQSTSLRKKETSGCFQK